MIREIITNVGTFGKFNDIKIFMIHEKIQEIEIQAIRLWNGDYLHKGLLGILSYSEILSINTIDV